ncbi:FeoA family protein [Thermodesulfovibrio hydrogeniphilus]
MIPLALLGCNERGIIIDVISKGKGIFSHLTALGFHPGKVVEVIDNQRGGPILIKIDNSRIAIGRGMAMKIMVRRTE